MQDITAPAQTARPALADGDAALRPIRVRAARSSDANALQRITADPVAMKYGSFAPFSVIEHWHQRLQAACQPRPDTVILVAETASVLAYAQLCLDFTNPMRRHVGLISICVDAQWRGRGVGSQLLDAMVHHADNWLGIVRLELHVWPDNAVARSLYLSRGFVEEGRIRAHALRDGRYDDAILMARIRNVPPVAACADTAASPAHAHP